MSKQFFMCLLILMVTIAKGQAFAEKIVNSTNSDHVFGAVEIQGDLYFSLTETDFFFGNGIRSIVYRADKSVNIIDSVNLTNYNNSSYFNITNLLPASDSSFWVIGDATYASLGSPSVHAILVNKDLTVIKDFTEFSTLDSTLYILNLAVLDSFIVASGYQLDFGFHPAYWVWDRQGRIVSKVVIDSVRGTMPGLICLNNRLFFGLSSLLNHSRGEINTQNFKVDTILKDDRITNGGSLFVSGYLSGINGRQDTVYAYGEHAARRLAYLTLDSNLSLISLDTFSTVFGKKTKADRGILSSSSPDKIYFVTGENPKFMAGDLQQGLTNSMKLWRINKNGDVIWSVLVNDSSYYLPTKTIATSDGGAVFFSMKYDWRIDPQPKTSLSIIKLDSTGNFVGLTEIEVPYQNLGIEVFPNPFIDKVTISGVEAREVRSATIYDVSGKVVSQKEQPESLEFDTSSFVPGTYFLQILLKTGQSGVYKVVRE